jgi:hypothetical protein
VLTNAYDWQSLAALTIVLVTVVTLGAVFVRRLRRSPKAGCGGDCGCGKTELRGK